MYVNLDSNQSLFLARQLEFIKAKTYDVKYPGMYAMTALPVSTEAGEGAETISYEQYDSTGIVKFIADYAQDLPRSDVKGKRFTHNIQSLGGSYGWSMQEVRAASMAKKNLAQMRAAAARRSNDQMQNKIGWLANGTAEWAGLYGILNHPNVTKSPAITGDWKNSTPDEILADINFIIKKPTELTNDAEVVDTLMIAPDQYAHIASTPRSAVSDTTILEFAQKVHKGVTFESVSELRGVTNPRTGSGTTNCAVAYVRDPDHLTYELPVIYEQFPVQETNLSYMVPVHSRVAGLIIYYPLSVHVVDGI